MTRAEAAQVVLVRAVEESDPEAVPASSVVDALMAAGDPRDEAPWFLRRAAHLLVHELEGYRPLLAAVDAPARGVWLLPAVALAVGLFSNYLGPSGRIHVVLNPAMVLIAWNLLLYAALLVRVPALRSRRAQTDGTRAAASAPAAEEPSPRTAPWVVRLLWPSLAGWRRRAAVGRKRAKAWAQVTRTFWSHWLEVTGPSLLLHGRRVLHTAAIALALGAVAGMYVRGLFLEYNVVWRSTFVRDPDDVTVLLRVLLGPAAFLSGLPVPDRAAALELMTPRGSPAATWIHLYALSALAFVVVPRALLATLAALRGRLGAGRVTLPLDDAYYRRILDHARRVQVQHVAEAIRADVRRECTRFAEGLARFVAETLYDARIVPRLRRFRDEGGQITDLEEAIRAEGDGFTGAIDAHLPVAQRDFERSLARTIEDTIGRELAIDAGPTAALAGAIGSASQDATGRSGTALGEGLGDVLGMAVSAAFAVVTGTLGGGFGKALGIAIVTTLTGTTGPLGFLLGALLGLVIAAAGWWLGRERLTGAIKATHLPATLLRAALWRSRFEGLVADGRRACLDAVQSTVGEHLDPLTPRIADEIWSRVKPVLGEREPRRPTGP
jgi:hypothetical protein